MLSQVRSGEVRIFQFRSVYVLFFQVRSCYVRVGLVTSG
jgi:hypothetical protein